MTSVAIIDDHSVVRMGLKYIIASEKDFTFAGECGSGAEAARFTRETQPDVLLLDVRMPGTDGLAALAEILAARPAQKVIMLTTSEADDDIYRALSLGAKGYLLKDRDSADICAAIRRVAAGGRFVPASVQALYDRRRMMPDLTPRERDVLALAADGLTNEEIAARLGISYEGVKLHMKHMFVKLDVRDRVGLVTSALRHGFVKGA